MRLNLFEFKLDKKNRRVELRIRNLSKSTIRGIHQGFFELGSALRADLNREVLAKDKKGRVYHVRTRAGVTGVGKRRRHRASAPGQTPANLSGNYRRNIGYQIHGSNKMEFGIRDGIQYAKPLEEGTNIMKPRPGLGNTVKKMQGQSIEYFEKGLKAKLL